MAKNMTVFVLVRFGKQAFVISELQCFCLVLSSDYVNGRYFSTWARWNQEGTDVILEKTPLILADVMILQHASDISMRILAPRVSNLDHGCMCNATPPPGCPAESIQGSVW